MLVDAMMLHPHTSIQRGGGCGMRLFGAANNMASVFFSFKSRQHDASHALTSITQRRIRSTADAESPRNKWEFAELLDRDLSCCMDGA